ncbi:MAG: hypothetical protein ILA15_08660 [Clostridiales bacterium]|nr:hypothetical protein [Clostridiales bacterium]
MNIYDRIAVKVLVTYLADYGKIERDKLIASMKSDHEVFVKILKAATKKHREERDWFLRYDSCQKYIQKEYLKYLDVIETPIYYDSAPVELFDTLERSFRKGG